MEKPSNVPSEAQIAVLSEAQAYRLRVPVQRVWYTLKTAAERPTGATGRMARDVWSLDGRRIGGTLDMDN